MASYADHGHDHAHEDEDDESGSLLEPVAVLRLLLQFLSAGSDSGDLELRERAGALPASEFRALQHAQMRIVDCV